MALLEVRDLYTGFGSHPVLHGVEFDVDHGEFVAILGLNGAGKSVTLNCVSGLVKIWRGSVFLDGDDISHLQPEDRVRAGLAHVPQGSRVFPNLTVEQNLRLGGATVADKDRYAANLDRVLEVFPRLRERMDQGAGTMSGGERAMLAAGRALMSDPKLLIVDEPSQGLAPTAVADLAEVLRQVNDAGTAVLLVEQNVTFAIRLAERLYLLQKGAVALHTAVEDLEDPSELLDALGMGTLLADRVRRAVAARVGR